MDAIGSKELHCLPRSLGSSQSRNALGWRLWARKQLVNIFSILGKHTLSHLWLVFCSGHREWLFGDPPQNLTHLTETSKQHKVPWFVFVSEPLSEQERQPGEGQPKLPVTSVYSPHLHPPPEALDLSSNSTSFGETNREWVWSSLPNYIFSVWLKDFSLLPGDLTSHKLSFSLFALKSDFAQKVFHWIC